LLARQHESLEKLSTLHKNFKVEGYANVFSELSKSVVSTSNFISQQGELIKKYLGDNLKTQKKEQESFKELFVQREKMRIAYMKAEKNLLEKKEKLFKKQDVAKWGIQERSHYEQEVICLAIDEYQKNKEKAFEIMLPNDTSDVVEKREQYLFYCNQCYEEF